MLNRLSTKLTATANRRRLIAFAPATLLLVLAGFLAFVYMQTRATRNRVGQARDAVTAAERVLSDLKDAETGQRGYLLLGDERYLTPYYEARARISSDTSTLRKLLLQSPAQTARLDSMRTLIDARIALADSTIQRNRAGDHAAAVALIGSGRGLRYMTSLRQTLNDIVAEESYTVTDRLAAENRYFNILSATFVAGTLLLLAFGVLWNRALLLHARKVEEQNELLSAQATELEVQQTELQEQNVELEVQQEQVILANEDLRELNHALDMAREEAEHANIAKSQFLASMSHELRTPLNAIGGYVDLIEAGVYGPITEKQASALARVQDSKRHLLTIITDILSYAGLAAGKLNVVMHDFDVEDVITPVCKLIEPLVEAKGLTLQCEVGEAGQRKTVHANADRVRQILVNLLGNAVKFTPSGGAIAISYREMDGPFAIQVRDTGIGIPPEKLDAIFQPFVQLDRTRHEGGGHAGIGLGLAISKELAISMNGDLRVESVPGQGSCFTLVLPRATSAQDGRQIAM